MLNGPLDAFYLRVKVALIVGIILSSPVWLYQLWRSSRRGCTRGRSGGGTCFLGTAVPLFLVGNALAYLSLGRSMHRLLGLTPRGVSNLIQV